MEAGMFLSWSLLSEQPKAGTYLERCLVVMSLGHLLLPQSSMVGLKGEKKKKFHVHFSVLARQKLVILHQNVL